MWPWTQRRTEAETTPQPHSDAEAIRQARADFVLNAVRQRLPDGLIWPEKRSNATQLDSVCVLSSGGVYFFDSYDVRSPKFSHSEGIVIHGDLGIRICHMAESHEALSAADIEQIIRDSNHQFDALVAADRHSITTSFARVTCVVQFQWPTGDIETFARTCLQQVADLLGYPLTYEPWSTRRFWLPTSDWYDAQEYREDTVERPGEFVFDPPLAVEDVERTIQSVMPYSGQLRPPGIQGKISSLDHVTSFNFAGRSF